MDDTSALSSDEEFALYLRVFRTIWNDRPWEFAKKVHTGTTDGSNYISLPEDFASIFNSNNYTDETSHEGGRPVVYVGPNLDKYFVASWSDRRQYTNRDNICYVDIVNSRLYFSTTPQSGLAVEFDYLYIPTIASVATTIPVPLAFENALDKAIFHGMCVDSFVIQQSDKAKSYQAENQSKHNMAMKDLALTNAQLIQM